MNWGLIGWFAGVMLTIGALKFVWAFVSAMTGKDARRRAVNAASERIQEAGENLSDYISKKAAERKQRKKEEERPIITIR